MSEHNRQSPPEMDLEYLTSMVGTAYAFTNVWSEEAQRWFVALTK